MLQYFTTLMTKVTAQKPIPSTLMDPLRVWQVFALTMVAILLSCHIQNVVCCHGNVHGCQKTCAVVQISLPGLKCSRMLFSGAVKMVPRILIRFQIGIEKRRYNLSLGEKIINDRRYLKIQFIDSLISNSSLDMHFLLNLHCATSLGKCLNSSTSRRHLSPLVLQKCIL